MFCIKADKLVVAIRVKDDFYDDFFGSDISEQPSCEFLTVGLKSRRYPGHDRLLQHINLNH